MASAALLVSVLIVGSGVWLARLPIAAFFIGAAFADRGVEADFRVTKLNLNGATLSALRIGAESDPDTAIDRVEVHWRWRGISPNIEALRLTRPHFRVRLDPTGRVSAGALDRLRGPPSGNRPELPHLELEIDEGQVLIDAPFGSLDASLRARGVLGRDFVAFARIEETTSAQGEYAIQGGSAELSITSRDEGVAVRFGARIASLAWDSANLSDFVVRLSAQTPLDLGRFDARGTWQAGAARFGDVYISRLNGVINGDARMDERALQLAAWRGQATTDATRFILGDVTADTPRWLVRASGDATHGRARWSLTNERLAGFEVSAEAPSAAGSVAFEFGAQPSMRGAAVFSVPRAMLTANGQARVRRAIPEFTGAPVGPPLAAARRAFAAAGHRFNARIPLSIDADTSGVRVRMTAPAQAQAASGARLRLSPLRDDAPALVLQWPGASLHGAIALDVQGGGAPTISLLLDTVDWRPGSPLESDGTLTLTNWNAEGASIAADELGVSMALDAHSGRIEMRGPVRISGPLGQGALRDFTPTLDIAVQWDRGWRVVANHGCLPARLEAIDAAGLAFSNGIFSLCSEDGALIAANTHGVLSGGFNVQNLALRGHMAGPEGQPARLSAASVSGRFRGRQDDVTLDLVASQPNLQVEMRPERTLTLAIARMTAEAHVSSAWRVAGAFEHGMLNDPALPGVLSAIGGAWSAAPEAGETVVRVVTAAALVTANAPEADTARPLFQPLRMASVEAVLRGGRIDASGDIVLAAPTHQLAHFSASHEIAEGLGRAHVSAPSLVFDAALQPYQITERARGMVENVSGSADIEADIVWTRDAIAGTGRAHLDGLALATATIPVVRDVRGDILFDDIFALTTPPGQTVTIGLVNPGIAVRNGRVRFQLLREQRVAIEEAVFEFAGGALAVSPATITLGAEETDFELTLRDVDAATLISQLNFPDLTASGRIEGSFPLQLTRERALISGGVLRANGGTIAYNGVAGASANGAARIAFDALRSFRYRELTLTLDGDLSGEVVSAISFSGENTGQPIDLGPIAPGLGRANVRGVPFNFHVSVTAPFRRLAQTAMAITDPAAILNQARGNQPDTAVTPPNPAAR